MAKKIIIDGKAAPLKNNQVYIQSGDTLSALSQRLTGSANNWKKIAEANNISDPNKIKPGQVLTVPEGIYNPMVSLDGKEYRWRDPEYRKAYEATNPETPKDRLSAYRQEQSKQGADAVRSGANKTASDISEVFHTVLNTADLPRRAIAAGVHDDYSLKDAFNVIGRQPYKSVTTDEFAAKHPYIAAGADIGTGLLAWNLPSITKSIIGTGANLARSEMAISNALDDFATQRTLPTKTPKQTPGAFGNKGTQQTLPKAAENSRKATQKIVDSNPNKYETLVLFPTENGGVAATKLTRNTKIDTKVGARVDPNRGKGVSGYKQSRTNVGQGQTQGAYTPGSENVGGFHYPIPVATPVKPTFLPIPGIPVGGNPPVVVAPQRERIEAVTPQSKTLDEIIRESRAQEGDTLKFPSGEEIVYIKGNSPVQRVFETATTNVYDAAQTPQEQVLVPGRTQLQWGAAPQSAGKYIPAVPKGEAREKKIYYPTLIQGQARYKPLK